ncbi:hypothetical protein BDR06DRAFT_1003029 [Suillus hirtellus]|nr:hypothetical protein BDR06DRAFT_1003029 [Suillus hirtellus]
MPPRQCALNTPQTSSPATVAPPINTPQTLSPVAAAPPAAPTLPAAPPAAPTHPAAPPTASTLTAAPRVAASRQYSSQGWSKPCGGRWDIQTEEDPSHVIVKYSLLTTTGTLRGHLLKIHLHVYITALEQHNLKVGAKEVRDLLDIGWTLAQIGQELDQNPDKLLESFGSPLVIPDFTIEEMHRQLVKFIVVDDQAMNVIECPEFHRLLLLLRKDLQECNIPHWMKLYLAKAEGKISFTSDLWSDES